MVVFSDDRTFIEKIRANPGIFIIILLVILLIALVVTGQVLGEYKVKRDIVPSASGVDFSYFEPVRVWGVRDGENLRIQGNLIEGSNICNTYTYENPYNQNFTPPNSRTAFRNYFTSVSRKQENSFLNDICVDVDQVRVQYVSQKCESAHNLNCIADTGEVIPSGSDEKFTYSCDYSLCTGELGSLCANFSLTTDGTTKLNEESKCLSIDKIFLPDTEKTKEEYTFLRRLNIIEFYETSGNDVVNLNNNIIVTFKNETCDPKNPSQKLKFLRYETPKGDSFSSGRQSIYTLILFRELNYYLDLIATKGSIKKCNLKNAGDDDFEEGEIRFISVPEGNGTEPSPVKTNAIIKFKENQSFVILYGGSGYETNTDYNILGSDKQIDGSSIELYNSEISNFVFKKLDDKEDLLNSTGIKWVSMPTLPIPSIGEDTFSFPGSYFFSEHGSVKSFEPIIEIPGDSNSTSTFSTFKIISGTNKNVVEVLTEDVNIGTLINMEREGYNLYFEIFKVSDVVDNDGNSNKELTINYVIQCFNFTATPNEQFAGTFLTNINPEIKEINSNFPPVLSLSTGDLINDYSVSSLKAKKPGTDDPGVTTNNFKLYCEVSSVVNDNVLLVEVEDTTDNDKLKIRAGINNLTLVNVLIEKPSSGKNPGKEITFKIESDVRSYEGKEFKLKVKDVYTINLLPNNPSPEVLLKDKSTVESIVDPFLEENEDIDFSDVYKSSPQQLVYMGDFGKPNSSEVGQISWFYNELKKIADEYGNLDVKNLMIKFFSNNKNKITYATSIDYLKSLQYVSENYSEEAGLSNVAENEKLILGKFIPYRKIFVRNTENGQVTNIIYNNKNNTQNLNYGINLKNIKNSIRPY